MAGRRGPARPEFDRFVDDCAADLLRTAYLVVWDLAEAEDLVQECLLRVARRWPRVRSMDHPTAYARRVLVNLALDGSVRRARRRSELDHDGRDLVHDRHDEAAARALRGVEVSTELVDALGELGVRQRATLVLRYFDDLTEAQVAAVLGCSVGTVKSTTARALERLRQKIGPADADASGHGDDDGPDTHDGPATHDASAPWLARRAPDPPPLQRERHIAP